MTKKTTGADRPDDYKRFSGLDKGYDTKKGSLSDAPNSQRDDRNK